MSIDNEAAKLLLFRARPENLMERPPLCSSLQNLESSFFLISLGRYPHALVACVSAVESSIKAAFNKAPEEKDKLSQLIRDAQAKYAALRSFPKTDLDDIRNARNRIIHYGFSPKDDAVSAALLLKTGFSFLSECYREFFGFDMNAGLWEELAQQLRLAVEVYQKARSIDSVNLTYCFRAFGHLVRWRTTDRASWEIRTTDVAQQTGTKFEACEATKRELERVFGTSWCFDCPICGEPDSFVCEMDEERLSARVVGLNRAVCVHCDLVIPFGCPFLTDSLCREQVQKDEAKVLREFGLMQLL